MSKSTWNKIRNNITKAEALTAKDCFPFGKWKGFTVAKIVKSDPQYILWWHNQLGHRIPISARIIKRVETFGLRMPRVQPYHRANHDADIDQYRTPEGHADDYNEAMGELHVWGD